MKGQREWVEAGPNYDDLSNRVFQRFAVRAGRGISFAAHNDARFRAHGVFFKKLRQTEENTGGEQVEEIIAFRLNGFQEIARKALPEIPDLAHGHFPCSSIMAMLAAMSNAVRLACSFFSGRSSRLIFLELNTILPPRLAL